MVSNQIPRIQDVLLPILREGLPDIKIQSWVDDIDYREYPLILVRRLGGYRSFTKKKLLDKPVVELTVVSPEGLLEAEELYIKALDLIIDAVLTQKVTDAGSLCFFRETLGMTNFSSRYMDTFRVQGLFQLGVRPAR